MRSEWAMLPSDVEDPHDVCLVLKQEEGVGGLQSYVCLLKSKANALMK